MLTTLREHITARHLLWKGLALLLAIDYFAFRTEIFSEEYERNHPAAVSDTVVPLFTLPSLTWETFDKDNAPKAIRIDPMFILQVIQRVPEESVLTVIDSRQPGTIRDKSPPPLPSI